MAEKDRWGRIPVKLIEIDQELCSLNWSERPCRAGPESNLLPHSRTPGQGPFWTTGGVTRNGAARTSAADNEIDAVDLYYGPGDSLSVTAGAWGTLPVVTSPVLSFAVEYSNAAPGDRIIIGAIFVSVANGASSPASITVDTGAKTATSSSGSISNILLTDMGGGWTRVSFDSEPLIIGGSAYAAFLEVVAFDGQTNDYIRVAQPQISDGALTDFAETDAEIKTPNEQPCFNTLSSCQSPDTYDPSETPLTLRFSPDDQVTPADFGAIPSVSSVRQQPARLSVGGTNGDVSALGARATLSVTFLDHPTSDLQTDPYVDQRSYDPMERGTFWGKWLARNTYRQNMPVRFVSGYLLEDGSVEEFSTYHYLLEKVDGPDSSGKVTLKAYDLLQSLKADRATFPAASPGYLANDMSDTATSFTLAPSGIGSEYPSSFRCRIGGEGFDVTRSGDTCSISGRGLYGGAESHSQDDTVQVVAELSGQVHDIAHEIITSAIPSLSGNINKSNWDGIADESLPRIYQADITEPTGVEDLLAELAQTAPVYWYADIRTNMIVMDAIREPAEAAVEINETSHIRKNSLSLTEFPKERIDEVWIYYRMRDPAGDVDDDKNYSQRYILVNADEQEKRGRRSVKRIYSRWIQAGARDAAEEIAQAYISRFQNPPIRVSFDLDAKDGEIWLGNVAKIISRQKQDATGAPRSDLNYQVIEAEEKVPGSVFSYMAQSYEFFSPVDPDNLTITIQPEDTVDGSGGVDQIDLRALYDSVVATEVSNITFIVAGGPGNSGGTLAGASAGQSWSVSVPNSWPWSPDIKLRIESGGAILGRAGDGGEGADVSGDADGSPGGNGGTALQVRYAIELDNNGIIGGGGGGGGGSACNQNSVVRGGGGGGGAGRVAGQRGPGGSEPSGYDFYVYTEATSGSLLTGGKGGYTDNESNGSTNIFQGGDGGNLGQPGQPGQTVNGGASPGGNGGAGGAAGNAIDGDSYITYINAGDIRGAII